jgi:hypothetical protein
LRDLDLSLDDVRLAVEGYYVAAGMGPDVIGGEEFAEEVSSTLADMADVARSLPVGAIVGRRLNHLVWRSEPSERARSGSSEPERGPDGVGSTGSYRRRMSGTGGESDRA